MSNNPTHRIGIIRYEWTQSKWRFQIGSQTASLATEGILHNGNDSFWIPLGMDAEKAFILMRNRRVNQYQEEVNKMIHTRNSLSKLEYKDVIDN